MMYILLYKINLPYTKPIGITAPCVNMRSYAPLCKLPNNAEESIRTPSYFSIQNRHFSVFYCECYFTTVLLGRYWCLYARKWGVKRKSNPNPPQMSEKG